MIIDYPYNRVGMTSVMQENKKETTTDATPCEDSCIGYCPACGGEY